MVEPRLRSRSKKRVQKRTPGGRTVTHYKREKPSKQKCGRCHRPLSGVPNNIPSKVRKLSKSEKIPSRPYAGVLCPECVEKLLRYQTRFEVKFKYSEFRNMELRRDLTIEKFLPRDWWMNLQKNKK
ncbi:MAG TPA: 50S ribosomal protein L34e [Candidatus Altiarchaeales archaeon]|nr:50S ribosomal protein L34e [Candidatus Altiarchaeales archaeon]